MREPVKQLLTQIGAKKGAAMTRACLSVLFISLRQFPYFTFRIIMSFRKPCHMPFRKLIPPFTLTASLTRLYSAAASPSERLRSDGSLAIKIEPKKELNKLITSCIKK